MTLSPPARRTASLVLLLLVLAGSAPLAAGLLPGALLAVVLAAGAAWAPLPAALLLLVAAGRRLRLVAVNSGGGPSGSGLWPRHELAPATAWDTTFRSSAGRLRWHGLEITVQSVHPYAPAARDASQWERDLAGAGQLRTWTPSPRLPALIDLDHAWVPPGLAVRSVRAVTIVGSDHRAVVARLVPVP